MNKIETHIDGLFIIKLDIFSDERGFFSEKYNKEKLAKIGLEHDFVQDNFSYSYQYVARGLHAQPGQGKLVGVTRGNIFDVAIDIRKGSKTYGKFESVELSAENGLMLWVPDGFLHGFQVLSNSADVFYKVTDFYNPNTQFGVNWLDPEININWPNKEDAILNARDLKLPYLSQIS